MHRSDGRVYVRSMAGEEFIEVSVQPTAKHEGGGIMVWGFINAKGVGFLTRVDGRLNREGCINILENPHNPTTHLLSGAWLYKSRG